jgi:hypothetical protein
MRHKAQQDERQYAERVHQLEAEKRHLIDANQDARVQLKHEEGVLYLFIYVCIYFIYLFINYIFPSTNS